MKRIIKLEDHIVIEDCTFSGSKVYIPSSVESGKYDIILVKVKK